MQSPINRRDFLTRTVKACSFAGLGDLAFFRRFEPVFAADSKAVSERVKFSPEIEPLVALIEETPRDGLLPAVAARIGKGLSYEELLAAIFLAGVRGIEPRPVGFKFHAVMVVSSVHLATVSAADNERWLPIFWALDNFKVSQADNKEDGDWFMKPAQEGRLPTSTQSKQCFVEAMDSWDEQGSDRAITKMVRSVGAGEIIELFWRYGARDFRDIGHKAIYTANAWRTMQLIGWRHAEPVMRSLAFALLEHEGDNPSRRDDDADRPWRENLQRASKIRMGWQNGKVDAGAVRNLLSTLRTASSSDACGAVVEMLNKEVDPATVWDGLFLQAGELLMRQPGIIGVHCITSINALHFGYQQSGNDETRRLLLLQAAAFLCSFRKLMAEQGKLGNLQIDTLESESESNHGSATIDEIFADVGKNPLAAARKTLAFLDGGGAASELIAAARRLILVKGTDAHDYKFSSAALEDYFYITPHWRHRYFAACMFNLSGSGQRDSDVVKETRALLAHPSLSAAKKI